jgi:predicted esterase
MSIRSMGCGALLLVGGLIATPGALGAAPAVPRLDAVTPDGDLTDWGPNGLTLPFLTPDSPRLPDAAKSGASARFAWDDGGLLMAIEVTDVTPSEAHIASAGYTADSVELFLAIDPVKPDNVQLVISPGRDPDHPKPRLYIFDSRSEAVRSQPIEAVWAVKPSANGYVVEARLPWAALGIRPATGLTVASRLYVNNDDGAGTRTRFVWQPEPGAARFHALTLGADAGSAVLDAPVAWTGLDLANTTGRINVIARAALDGSAWQVRQGDALLGELKLRAAGNTASGTLELPAGRAAGPLTLSGPDNVTLTVRDALANDAADAIARAGGGRVGPAQKSELAFARAEFAQHVFSGRRFPTLNFADPARVERLLGAAPAITTRWLDADGRDVDAPASPGRYAARSEITLPGRPKPIVLEHIFYRVPPGVGVSSAAYDETAARVMAFGLQGADATPSHIARVAERWWHGVRRARGWSEPLAYKINVPEGAAAGPRPLVVHLHGSGQHSEQAVGERLPLLVSLAGPEAIVVWPQSPGGWRGPAVGEFIDALLKQHDIDPKRIYLIGFSLGGLGCWEVALDQPERFAAVVPIGGRMGSPADAARLKDVPVWVFNGEFDPTTTCEEAALMVEALRSAGGKPQFTIQPGMSHGDSQDAAYRHPGLFEWMLKQRRGR